MKKLVLAMMILSICMGISNDAFAGIDRSMGRYIYRGNGSLAYGGTLKGGLR